MDQRRALSLRHPSLILAGTCVASYRHLVESSHHGVNRPVNCPPGVYPYGLKLKPFEQIFVIRLRSTVRGAVSTHRYSQQQDVISLHGRLGPPLKAGALEIMKEPRIGLLEAGGLARCHLLRKASSALLTSSA